MGIIGVYALWVHTLCTLCYLTFYIFHVVIGHDEFAKQPMGSMLILLLVTNVLMRCNMQKKSPEVESNH